MISYLPTIIMAVVLSAYHVLTPANIGQGSTEKVIARINGEAVFADEYFSRMEYLPGVGVIQEGRFHERPPAFLTILNIINDRIILQLAKEKGVAPTQGEIDKEFNEKKAQDPERFKTWNELGMSDALIKKQIAVELAQFNLITNGVVITDAQVTEHYNTNKLMYVIPATVKLRVIVVNTITERLNVDDALKTKSFEVVAREKSVDITKYTGGDLPEVSIGNLPQNILNEVSRTPAGQSTAWIESENVYMKYLVEKKNEAKQLPLDTNLKQSIKRQLMLEVGRNKNNVRAMLDDMRKKMKVEISSPGLQKLWDAYIKDYLQQIGG